MQAQFARYAERIAKRIEAQDLEKTLQQVSEGRCSLVPMPMVSTKPFRAELYTERLPLFAVDTFIGNSRVIEAECVDPESGETVFDRLLIGRTFHDEREKGVLRHKHQVLWFHLLKKWNDAGYPLVEGEGSAYGQIKISARQLVRELCGGESAMKYKRVRCLLGDLASIPIYCERHSQDRTDAAEFRLVHGFEWVGRELNKQRVPTPTGKSEIVILLSKFITAQFLRQAVKPLLLEPYLMIGGGKGCGRRSQIGALLYPKLDRELANKKEYHRKLGPLLAELGIRDYRYKSERRRKMLNAVKALSGQPIQNERYTLHVSLREAADQSDYVLVAKRTKQTELKLETSDGNHAR